MMATNRRSFIGLALALAALVSLGTFEKAKAATAEDLNKEAQLALDKLYRTNPVAKDISEKAEAVLVFPSIVKAGLVFGGAYGEGVLMEDGAVKNYYNSVTGSWGLQAGAQSYGYAVFLMNDKAVNYLKESHGWELGVGPTVVVVDEGAAKNLSTSTLKEDAYAFIFDQEGLMAGVSIEGTKISEIER
jgi:lipid-binding SYLF domain-containing protein|tara:strand:+ start:2320 stop:2883 length:564 start_codon:yes stop_codon:yes gene_type:complete